LNVSETLTTTPTHNDERLCMTAIRAAAFGGGIGGVSGAFVGGGIAQFLAGPGTLGVLWLAAVLGAAVAGIVSALVIRSSACTSGRIRPGVG
jgi:hypothetical protein